MKNKIAVWSWILSIVSVILYIFIGAISSSLRVDAGIGSPITSTERSIALIFSVVFLLIILTGLIFGFAGLRKVKNNSNVGGGLHAVIGIILNTLLFFVGLLMFGSSLIGG
ncbi:MAG: hypothetical protein AAB677_00360 [Patescibacteria group bacterium]